VESEQNNQCSSVRYGQSHGRILRWGLQIHGVEVRYVTPTKISQNKKSHYLSDWEKELRIFCSYRSDPVVSERCCYLLTACIEDYRVVGGSRRWGTSCTYDFFSTDDVTSGRFFSEKFPQNYPASVSCSYVFVSAADQVITLTFSSIRLANGRRLHYQQQQQQSLDESRSVWGQLHYTSYSMRLFSEIGDATFEGAGSKH